jgi:predicted nucleotide-binding protein
MSIEFLTSNAEKVNYLCALLKSRATGKDSSNSEFQELRHELLSNNSLSVYLPSWLKLTRDLDAFWDFIQPKFGTYQERRSFLDQEFVNLLNHLEFCEQPVAQNTSIFPQSKKKATQSFSKVRESVFPSSSRQTSVSFEAPASKAEKKNKVFVVHGRDNEAKQEAARYIESVGLEAIILHEQASSGMTIIEKIEHYAGEADFAIVIYTACDKGRGAFETKVPARDRARQNVVFEHGYLMAKLGRKNVCALVKGQIETPNDISGVVYVSMDQAGAWKTDINKELKACGYSL